MLLDLSTFAASQTDSVKARRHGLAPALAARLRRLCWPLVVVVWPRSRYLRPQVPKSPAPAPVQVGCLTSNSDGPEPSFLNPTGTPNGPSCAQGQVGRSVCWK